MFTWAFVIIEALSAVGLIFLVLLHSGRGGGISDLLGGSMGASRRVRPSSSATSTALRSPSP